MSQPQETPSPVDAPSPVGLNAFVGFVVGIAGGLVGLGGAELRLPYLAGTLRLPLKTGDSGESGREVRSPFLLRCQRVCTR